MDVRIGKWDYQELLDTYDLERQMNDAVPDLPMVRIFVDTIDEKDTIKTFIDREGYMAVIVHIKKSDFDAQPDKMEYAKQKVIEAIEQLDIRAKCEATYP